MDVFKQYKIILKAFCKDFSLLLHDICIRLAVLTNGDFIYQCPYKGSICPSLSYDPLSHRLNVYLSNCLFYGNQQGIGCCLNGELVGPVLVPVGLLKVFFQILLVWPIHQAWNNEENYKY